MAGFVVFLSSTFFQDADGDVHALVVGLAETFGLTDRMMA